MIEVYIKLIINGRRSFEQIPDNLKEDVKSGLAKLGYDQNGNKEAVFMSALGVKAVKALNKVFPKVVHPFNMQMDGEKTYAMWQFEKGEDTIKNYLGFTNKNEMFKDKTVLESGRDVGCTTL